MNKDIDDIMGEWLSSETDTKEVSKNELQELIRKNDKHKKLRVILTYIRTIYLIVLGVFIIYITPNKIDALIVALAIFSIVYIAYRQFVLNKVLEEQDYTKSFSDFLEYREVKLSGEINFL